MRLHMNLIRYLDEHPSGRPAHGAFDRASQVYRPWNAGIVALDAKRGCDLPHEGSHLMHLGIEDAREDRLAVRTGLIGITHQGRESA
jgi:hypothetical protein